MFLPSKDWGRVISFFGCHKRTNGGDESCINLARFRSEVNTPKVVILEYCFLHYQIKNSCSGTNA